MATIRYAKNYKPSSRAMGGTIPKEEAFVNGLKEESERRKKEEQKKSSQTQTSQSTYQKTSSNTPRNTVEEELSYAESQLRKLSKENRETLEKIVSTQKNPESAHGRIDFEFNKEKKAAEKEFKANTGVDDKTYKKYLQYARELKNEKETKDIKEKIKASMNSDNEIANSLYRGYWNMYDIAMSPLTGIVAAGEGLINKNRYADKNAPVDTNSVAYTLHNISTTNEDAQSEYLRQGNGRLNKTVGKLTGKDLGGADAFLYGTGMSMGKAALSMAIGGSVAEGLGLGSEAVNAAKAAGNFKKAQQIEKAASAVSNLVTLPQFGTSSYATTLQEAQDRGLSQDQAQATALVAGAAEMVFEKLSVDHFWDIYKNSGAKAARKAIVNVLAQSGIEGSEEVFTDIANEIADRVINKGQSEYEQNVKQYGKDKAKMMFYSQLGQDFLGGAISGAVFGGFGVSANHHQNVQGANERFGVVGEDGKVNYTGEQAAENYAQIRDSIPDVGNKNQSRIGSEAKQTADLLRIKAQNNIEITQDERTDLYQMEQYLNDQYAKDEKYRQAVQDYHKANATQGVSQTLTDLNTVLDNPIQTVGSNEQQVNATLNQVELETPEKFRAKSDVNIEDAISNINNANNVEELANAYNEAKASAKTPQDNGIIENLMNSRKQKMNVTNEDLENVMTLDKAYQTGVRNEELTTDDAFVREAYNEGRRNRLAQNSPKTATARANGRDFTIDTIKNVKGETYVTTNEGETVPLSVVSFANPEMSDIYEEASLSANPQAFIDGYTEVLAKREDASLGGFASTVNNVYNYARLHGNDGTFEKAIKNEAYAKMVPEATLKTFYEDGLKKAPKDKKAATAGGRKVEPGVKNAEELDEKSRQLVENVAKKTKTEISFLDKEQMRKKAATNSEGVIDKEKLAKYIEKNIDFRGMFNQATNEISLNKEVVDGNIFKTLVHEAVGEMMEAYAPEEMSDFQLAVIDYALAHNPTPFYERVADYLRNYQKVAEINQTEGEELRDAANEYVNDILYNLFATEEGMREFSEFVADKPKTIKERFIEFIDNLIQSIKDLMGSVAGKENYFKNDIKTLEDLRKMALDTWQTAIDNKLALENGKTELKQASSLDVRNSIDVDTEGRELNDSQKTFFKNSKIVDKDGKLLVLYHGTPVGGFNEFRNPLNFFTPNRAYAERYANQDSKTGEIYEVYLNVEKPFDITNPKDRQIFIDEYVKGGWSYSIDPSLSDKEIAARIKDGIDWTEADNLKEFLEENDYDYDGLILNEGGDFEYGDRDNSYVIFESRQAKRFDNENPTKDADIRFSLDVPEEESKTLIAIHNLSAEKMMQSLDLGGFPMPSIAVTTTELGHTNYGDVSVLFGKDTVDPAKSRKNKIYGGDAWTPTVPRLESKVNEKVAEKIRLKIDSLVDNDEQRALGFLALDNDNLEEQINNRRGDVIDAYKDKRGMKYAFLKDNGIELDVPQTDKRLSNKFDNDQVLAGTKVVKDLKQAEDLRMNTRSYENNPEIVEGLRQALNDHFRQKHANALKGTKLAEKDLYDELSYSDFDQLTVGLYKYYRDGITQEMDSSAMRDAIDEEMKGREKEYEKWLSDLFDGIVEKQGLRNNKELFTYTGNRRSWDSLHDDYNLDNIVKIMSQQDEKGEAGFFSVSKIQAIATKNFKNLNEVRKAKSQLRMETEEEHEARVDEQSERFTEICNEIKDERESNSFIAFGRASDAIADAVSKYHTVQGIDRELREWTGLNIQDDTAQKIVDLMKDIAENPTGYFEAKPQRAVELSEIERVIVPHLEKDLMAALDEKNIPYTTYKAGDDEARKAAVNSVPEIRFSIEVDSNGKELTTGQKRFFNNTKAVDEDGDLQRVFHGTLSEFYEFDKEKANPEGNLGKGFYFTNVDYDAENNYADRNGPDFTNKVEREAELLEDDERYSEMDHDEIVEMLKDKYATDPMVLEGYLNIQNPVYINKEGKGDTYLFDFEDELPNYDDFEDEDEYYQEVEDIVGDKVYEALDAVKDYLGDDYYESEIETLSEIIGTAAMEGGITYEQLRSRLNDANAFFETEDGIAQSEVLRIIAESLGYDGIIDSSVSDKFKAMDMPFDTTHYVVFNSNQFKLADNENPTDNPDIRYSVEVDTEGNKLTEDQQRYFKDSKVVDDQGRLKVMFHGTERADFTVFDPEYADDGISLFFTDNETVAKGYSGTKDKVKFNYTLEDLNKMVGGYEDIVKEGDTYKLREYIPAKDDYKIIFEGTFDEMKDYVVEWYGETGSGNYEVYLNITNPYVVDANGSYWDELPHGKDTWTTRDYADYAKKNGYDGLIVNNVIDTAVYASNMEKFEPSQIVVAFDSNQVKSIENKTPTKDADIRYSIEVEDKLDDIKKRAKRYSMYDTWEELEDAGLVGNYNKVADDTMAQILDSVNNLFKGQEIGANSIKTVAKEIKEYTGSTINTATLEDELDMLFNHMQREDNQLNMDEMFDLFKVVARDVVKKMPSESVDDEFRSYVKSLKISLTDTQKEEVAHVYGSYNEFRQRNMGNLTITNDGMTLDELWNEIADQSNFGLSDNVSEAEQPLVLVDYLNALKEQPLNNYGASMDELATDTAIRILEKYYAAEQQALTNKALLDNPSAKKALDDARANMRKADQEFRKQVKEKYDAEVERLTKEREDAINSSQFFYKRTKDLESQLANASSEADKEEIRKLKSQLDRKDKALIKAQAKAKQPLTEYQEQLGRKEEKRKIMQISNRLMKMVYAPTEKLHMPEEFRKPIGEFLNGIDFISHRGDLSSINNVRWQTKMDNLRAYLSELGTKPNATQNEINLAELLEPELLEDMEKFSREHADIVKLSRLKKNELHDLYNILTRLSATVSKTNQTFANSVYADITKLSEDSLDEMKQLSDPKINGGVLQSVKDFFEKNLEDPITYFSLLGKAPKTIYDGLLKGFDRRAGHIKDSQEYMQSILPKDAYKWEKEKHTFETHNGKLELSTAQIMSLYELNKRKAAGHHLFSGGIKGLYTHLLGNETQSNKTYHLTDQELNNIFGVLTQEQIEIADKIQEYMANECAKWGNNVSMTLWGYNKFTEKDYFPMKVDSTSRATSNNDTNVPNLYANKNMSSSKELKDMADNPLLIGSIFDVFTEHVADMATYDGMVLPQMDAMRWFNYKVKDIEGGGRAYFDSTKQEINRLYSKAGETYFTNLMLGINGTEPKARGVQILNWLIGHYKKVAVMAKIRVAIQQPTSITRAYDEMDAKYLSQALATTNPVKYSKIAKENSNLAWWKGQGYYEAYLGKGLKEIIVGKNPIIQKIEDFEGWGAQTADDLTWGILYHAAEIEIKDKHPELKGKDFTDAVVERFEDVVSKTQVVDTMLHRTDIMRSQSELAKITTSFMTEPLKTYNMLLRSIVGAWREKDKKSIAHLVKTIFVYLINGAFLSMVTTTWDALRKDDDETKYGDRWLELYGQEVADNLNPLTMIPVVKDVVDIISAKFNGEYRSGTDMTYDGISRAAQFGAHVWKKAGGGELSITDYGLAKEGAQALSILSGVPVYNIWNDIEGIHNGFFDNWETKVQSPYKQFYKAIDNDEDIVDAVNKLHEAGKEDQYIKSQITSHYKPTYLETTDMTEKANLKNRLIKAYMAAGDSREDAIKKIDKW